MLPNDGGAGRFATFGAGNQTANNASGFPMGGTVALNILYAMLQLFAVACGCPHP